MSNYRRYSGLLLMDAIVALSILGVLLGVLASAMAHHRHALSRMETQRRLNRLAESVLTDLQQGVEPDVSSWEQETEPTYTIEKLDSPGPCEQWVWIEINAQFEKQQSSLTGAVPLQALSDLE